jgi:membrane protein
MPVVLGDEDGTVDRRALDLDEGIRAWLGADLVGGSEELGGGFRKRFRGGVVQESRGDYRPIVVGENRRFDLRGDLGEIGESLRRVHAGGSYHRPDRREPYTPGGVHRIVSKFLADRGTHLAAMIAYFALLSFVPLLFLALTALAGQQTVSSYLVEELRRAFPASSVDRLLSVVRSIQDQATSIGIIGGIALLWGALGFFSVLESAFNIVYGLPNRSFVRQKLLVLLLVAGSLAVLFVALVVGSVGVDLVQNAGVASGALSYVYALAISTALIFGLVWTLYNLLTNAALTWGETFPGAVFATVLLQASFQALPAFVRLTSGDLVTLQAFGGLVLLLFWLYLMANVLVLGAEVNWWFRYGRAATDELETAGTA